MCSINGILAYRAAGAGIDRAELIRTRDWMAARGPDGAGEWFAPDGTLGLAHRRLAIIDLSAAGAQPMTSADGRYTIVFNGEIYNYRELRERLALQGVRFRSHSDTEVLLHLYAQHGDSMVNLLRGMFAFGIWDQTCRTLFLARDPYGIKPLYYADDRGTFRFASQVKALLAGKALSPAVDPAALAGFLVWGSIPEPLTFHQGIQTLPAGHTLQITPDGPGIPRAFWNLGDVILRSIGLAATIPIGQEVEVLRAALRDSVRAHLVADVPVGAFLSAGLDSSTLVGFAKELSGDLRTITFGSEEFRGSEGEEGPLAAEVARHFGVSHERHEIGRAEFDRDVDAFLHAMDQPSIDGLNTWFVSKAAHQSGLKVALSGLGGDELFGSYASFAGIPAMMKGIGAMGRIPAVGDAILHLKSAMRRPKNRMRAMHDGVTRYGHSYDGAYLMHRGWIPPWQLHRVVRPDLAREGLLRLEQVMPLGGDSSPPGLNDFGKVAYLEATRYMRNQLLRDADWASMAHSLEVRVPLVDTCLTEAVIGLAATGRFQKGKGVLADAVPRGLPDCVVNRPKTGFLIPLWGWLNKSAKASAWKRNRFLCGQGVGDYSRWAYCILSTIPAVATELR